ncbi:oligosaccharide flippase family protein [Yersinia wautersii]|uniref:oligosaccharide flippase family protein n=1 Tax=Yersinia wautersii TaxID=1341643 RepID=UPI00041A459B|nr:oligosaccharide flippase family protein [Yersinia wautersii]
MVKIIFILFSSSIFASALTFLTQVILARNLSPASYGIFSSYLSLIVLMSVFSGFGSDSLILKFNGFSSEKLNKFKKSIIYYDVSGIFITSLILIFIVWIEQPEVKYISIFLLTCNLSLYMTKLVSSILQINSRYNILALWQSVLTVIRFILILGIQFFTVATITNIIFSYILASIITCIIGAKIVIRFFNNSFSGNIILGKVFRQASPFGIAALCHLIYFQSDIILINYFSSSIEAGYYTVAFTIISSAYLITAAIYQKYLLPKVHYWYNHDKEKIRIVYKKGGKIMLVLSLIIVLFIQVFSKYFVLKTYGEDYVGAIIFIKILSICIIFRFMSSNIGVILSTGNLISKKTKAMLYTAVLNIVTNIILIPMYGAIAACYTTLLCELFLMFQFYLILNKSEIGQFINKVRT